MEFALTIGLLVLPLLNVMDLGFYVYQRMLLDNAAQVAVQKAWATCTTPANLPATPQNYANCPGLLTTMTAAAQSTSLGTRVTIVAPTEDFKCVSTSGTALVSTNTFPTVPTKKCDQYGGFASDTPGDYIQVTASFSYSPLFTGITVAGLLTTPITRTASMRLG